jgi:hypothetical protein
VSLLAFSYISVFSFEHSCTGQAAITHLKKRNWIESSPCPNAGEFSMAAESGILPNARRDHFGRMPPEMAQPEVAR